MFRLPPALNPRRWTALSLPRMFLKTRLRLVLSPLVLSPLVLTLAVLSLAACSGRVPQTQHQVRLTGDNDPRVAGAAINAPAPSGLAEGESRVVGLDADGAHVPPLNNLYIELFAWVDKDQVPPVQRNENRPPAVRLNAQQYVLSGQDWTTVKQVDVAKLGGEERVQHLRYLVINHGNKPFHGDLAVQGHPARALRFLEATAVFKVRDQREVKEALAFIPPLGLLAMGMENYAPLEGPLDWSVETQDGRFHFLIRNLTLDSYEGVIIEYSAELASPSE